MPALKSPVDKLPLSLRKNIRDKYEAKRPELESKISELMGETWTIAVNPNLLFAYAEDSSGKERLGDVIMWYFDPFISNLKSFLDKFGADGKSDLNAACSAHQLTLHPQEDTTFSYGGLEIKDGVLRIVFADTYLGTNTSDVSQDFASALKAAPPPPGGAGALNIESRNAIREDYDPEIEKVRAKIAELVGMPDIKLNGNFEHNATELAKLDKDVHYQWDKKIGQVTLAYFEGVAKAMERLGFKGDHMLQEGFQEGVEKGEICLRIVDKLGEGNSYNEVVVEEGMLFVQTIPTYWYTNVDDPALKLLDIL